MKTFLPEPPGTRFGRWTLIETTGTNKHKMRLGRVKCDCGNEAEVIMANLRAGVSRQCRECCYKPDVHPRAKLTLEHVAEIKRRILKGDDSLAQIARDYSMSYQTLWRIAHDRIWKFVPWPK